VLKLEVTAGVRRKLLAFQGNQSDGFAGS